MDKTETVYKHLNLNLFLQNDPEAIPKKKKKSGIPRMPKAHNVPKCTVEC